MALSRRLEVEAGLGLVALAMAASLSSAPPATDVTTGRATLEEVRRIFTPQWPRWQAPSAVELAAASDLGDPSAPGSAVPIRGSSVVSTSPKSRLRIRRSNSRTDTADSPMR